MGLAALAPFQNCSMVSDHKEMNEFASKACNVIIGDAYKKTYYEDFRRSCTNCHDAGGIAGRPFASANFSEAVESFLSVGRLKIEGNALNPGHKPPMTGPQHLPMISAATQTWRKAEAVAGDCFEDQAVKTVGKTPPANVYTTTPGTGATWPLLTYDLRTELENPNDVPFPVNAQVTVEIRRFRAVNANNVLTDMSYEMKNPKVKVLGADTNLRYRIKNIKVRRNDETLSDFTFFNEVDRVFTGALDVLLQFGGNFSALVPLQTPVNSDKIALQFSLVDSGPELRVALPGRIGHSDLVGPDNIYGVFRRYCTNCHNQTQAAANGNLNLNLYRKENATDAINGAFDRQSQILDRMQTGTTPHGPIADGGAALEVVQAWINGQAPQVVGSSNTGGGGTVTLPARVSHTDLLNGSDLTVGVFRRYCTNCHNTANQANAAGLDLTNYDEAFALRTTIRARMNDNNNPMPPNGLIPDNGIALQVIDIWLSSGAPQN